MDSPVTFEDLGSVISLLIVGATSLGGVWWTIHRRISAVERRAEEIRSRGAHELAEFKLTVAAKYATHEAIKEVEGRIVGAIDRIGDRFDKYLDHGAAILRRGGGN